MTTKQIILKASVALLLTFFIVSISTAQVVEEAPPPPEQVEKAAPPPPPPPPPPPSKAKITELFEPIEIMPRFPGCEDISDTEERKLCAQKKMLDYIYSNLKYPKEAKENGVEGTCVIRFYVDLDGSMKEPEILRDIGAGCGEEALRIINKMKNMPERWIPGTQRGIPVKIYFNMPVKFRLDK